MDSIGQHSNSAGGSIVVTKYTREFGFNNISKEVKEKLTECKTQEEMKQILAEAGVEPLDDELLDAVAGGFSSNLQSVRVYDCFR